MPFIPRRHSCDLRKNVNLKREYFQLNNSKILPIRRKSQTNQSNQSVNESKTPNVQL